MLSSALLFSYSGRFPHSLQTCQKYTANSKQKWSSGMKKGMQWEGRLAPSKLHRCTRNILPLLRALLGVHIELQKSVNGKERSGLLMSIFSTKKKARTISFRLIAPSPIVPVNLRHVNEYVRPSSILEVSLATWKIYDNLLIEVRGVFKIYDLPFQKLLNAVSQSGEDIAEQVYSLICVPPYSFGQISEL